MALEDYYQGSPPPSADVIIDSTNDWAAQTFTAGSSYTIETLKLYLHKDSGGDCGTITVSIKAVDGVGKPTGADLAFGTFAGASLTTSYAWITFDLGAGTALTNGTEYAIVVKASAAGSSPNRLSIGIDDDPVYGGNRFFSTNGESSWNGPFTQDLYFEAYSAGESVSLSGTISITLASSANLSLGVVNVSGTIAIVLLSNANLLFSKLIRPSASLTIKRVVAAGNNQIWYEDI